MDLAGLAEGFLEDAPVELVEVVGLHAVVAGGAVVSVEVLVAQAQKLDEVEAVGHRGELFGRHADAAAALTQALGGAGGLDAGAQREHSGGIHEQAGAELFKVDGAGVLGIVVGDEIADLAQRRRHIQRVGGHRLEEGRVAAGHREQPVAQPVGDLLVAVEDPEVEEDGGVEQRLGVGFADPLAELLAPFVVGEAQLRVAGHDVALAQREAAGGEVVVHVLGKLEQAQLEGFLVGPFGQHVDDPVVLVGGEGLLVAAFGAEGEPGVFDAVQVVAVEVELEDAAGEGVVEGRDELGELLGADALGQQVEGQLADVAAGALQGLDVGGALDAGADLAQADALQGEQVALGDHALELVFGIHHQDVAHAVGGHLEGRVVGAGVGVEGVGRRGHHVGDGPGEVEAGEHDALEDVALGEHADGLLVFAGHGQAADAGRGHFFKRAAGGHVGADEDRRLLDQIGERRGHRLLLGGALGELGLELLPRLAHQAGDVAGAEDLEGGRELLKAQEIGGRELEAVAVLDGDVAVGGAALGGDRADREAFAGAQGERGVFGDGDAAHLARLHLAAIDDVEEARGAVFGHQDFGFGRVEGGGQPFTEKAQGFRLHPVERRVTAQELQVGSDQGVGGSVFHKLGRCVG